jgi:hypothetical protein
LGGGGSSTHGCSHSRVVYSRPLPTHSSAAKCTNHLTHYPSILSWSPSRGRRDYAQSMGVYALVEIGDPEAIDLFLRKEDAVRALEDALRDEPGWAGTLSIESVELDEGNVSPNWTNCFTRRVVIADSRPIS